MKKIILMIIGLFIITGCGMMNNTPTKKVEALLNKYQTNDKDVIDDLDNVLLMDSSFTDDERNDYREFMKKHYQDMTYKIKKETIDGDSANVEVEITVRNYSNEVNDANQYRLKNSSKFDENNTFASYRLNKLKGVRDTETYTIMFYLTKVNDEWSINPLSSEDENKLNGLYGVDDVNETRNTTDDSGEDTNNSSNMPDSAGENNTDNSSNMPDSADENNTDNGQE